MKFYSRILSNKKIKSEKFKARDYDCYGFYSVSASELKEITIQIMPIVASVSPDQ